MAQTTGIEWTDATLNIAWGCTKVSTECAECYIPNTPPLRKAGLKWARGHIPLRFFPERLTLPLRWRKPKKIFVNSLSDTFHEDMPEHLIDGVFASAAACYAIDRGHVFQILTKRPERMRDYLLADGIRDRIARRAAQWCEDADLAHDLLQFGDCWPLPNVWCGTTIGNRARVDRADVLRETPAAVRFISAEPLLGPLIAPHHLAVPPIDEEGDEDPEDYEVVPFWDDQPGPGGPDELYLSGIDWLICGGESGNHLRRKPYRFLVDVDGQPREDRLPWVRDLRDACVANGTAFFFKQFGGRTPKSGGRELDGREWSEFPQVGSA